MPAILWVILALLGFLAIKGKGGTSAKKVPTAATPANMYNGIPSLAATGAAAQSYANKLGQQLTSGLQSSLSSKLGLGGGSGGGSSGGGGKSGNPLASSKNSDDPFADAGDDPYGTGKPLSPDNPYSYNANLQDQSTVFGGPTEVASDRGYGLDYNSNLVDESNVFGGPSDVGASDLTTSGGSGGGSNNFFSDASTSGVDLSGGWGGTDLSTGFSGNTGVEDFSAEEDSGGDGGDGGGD